MPVALLALFKAGGVYVPLDPSYPVERLRTILTDANVAAVITETRWLPRLSLPAAEPAADLSRFLLDRLPAYMVPARFLLLAQLPLTPNGKVARQSLPASHSGVGLASDGLVLPRTPTERQLADIWMEVLGLDRVGIHDNFFELGGHSLLGVMLFARIEERLGERLPLALLFSAPTIAQLARQLEQPVAMEQHATLVPIRQSGNRAPFFCVHGFGGGVLGYADPARQLGSDQLFCGLQSVSASHFPNLQVAVYH